MKEEATNSEHRTFMPAETIIGKTVLRLVTGDIAEQDTDAVVTAALAAQQRVGHGWKHPHEGRDKDL